MKRITYMIVKCSRTSKKLGTWLLCDHEWIGTHGFIICVELYSLDETINWCVYYLQVFIRVERFNLLDTLISRIFGLYDILIRKFNRFDIFFYALV